MRKIVIYQEGKTYTFSVEDFFDLLSARVVVDKEEGKTASAEASMKICVDSRVEHTAESGQGPVNALDLAMRKALEKFYPSLKQLQFIDYKVTVVNGACGTAAQVKVFLSAANGQETWGAEGVSDNIIEASWQALTDSIRYHLMRTIKK